MTNKEYRDAEGISRSSLFKISKSPAHFKFEQDNPPEPTSALIFGKALHSFILEPENFDNEFAIIPNIDRRTKEGKAIYAEFFELCKDKDLLSQEDFEIIKRMGESVLNNKYAAELLTGQREQSFFWFDELTGEKCKVRPDILTHYNDFNVITDLKSCASADTETFTRDCIKFGYDFQAAMYKEGIDICTGKPHSFIFIAVEKSEPYAVNVLQADELFIRRGQEVFRELLGIYHNCKETGNWYGYNGFSGKIGNLSLPRWMAKDYE